MDLSLQSNETAIYDDSMPLERFLLYLPVVSECIGHQSCGLTLKEVQ